MAEKPRTRANFPRMRDRARARRNRRTQRLVAYQLPLAIDGIRIMTDHMLKLGLASADAAGVVMKWLALYNKEKVNAVMQSYPIADSTCASCGYVMDSTTDMDGDAKPSDGDYTVCLKCSAIGRFQLLDDGLLHIRRINEGEEIPSEVVFGANRVASYRMEHPWPGGL